PPKVTAATFPLTHLWFLYWLLMLYAGALILRGLVSLVDRQGMLRMGLVDPLVRGIVKADLTPIVFGAPLCLTLILKPDWLSWFGVPGAENGIIPNLGGVVAYSTAFGFGWLLNRQIDLVRVWEARWQRNLVIAVALTTIALWMAGTQASFAVAPQDGKK